MILKIKLSVIMAILPIILSKLLKIKLKFALFYCKIIMRECSIFLDALLFYIRGGIYEK